MKVLSIIKSVMPKNFENVLEGNEESQNSDNRAQKIWNLEEYHRKLKWWRRNGSFNEDLYYKILHLRNNLDIQ